MLERLAILVMLERLAIQVILATKELLERQAIQETKERQVIQAIKERQVIQEYKEKQALQVRLDNHRPTTIIKRMRMTIRVILEMAIFYGIMQPNSAQRNSISATRFREERTLIFSWLFCNLEMN
jgi:hypothetical protein